MVLCQERKKERSHKTTVPIVICMNMQKQTNKQTTTTKTLAYSIFALDFLVLATVLKHCTAQFHTIKVLN